MGDLRLGTTHDLQRLRLSTMCGGGAGSESLLPSAESLLGRMDKLDNRLRQLEEKQRFLPGGKEEGDVTTSNYYSEDLRATWSGCLQQQQQKQLEPCFKPLSSALHEVHLKGTLMDRLRLLESRIRQLSFDLDKSNGVTGMRSRQANGWVMLPKEMEEGIKEEEEEEEHETNKHGNVKSSAAAAAAADGFFSYNSDGIVVGAPRRSGELFHRGTRKLQEQKAKGSRETISAAKREQMPCAEMKRRGWSAHESTGNGSLLDAESEYLTIKTQLRYIQPFFLLNVILFFFVRLH